MMESRGAKIGLLATATFLLAMTVVVNYLSSSDIGRSSGLFENKNTSGLPWSQRGNIIDCGITPPRWAFIIWGVIYAYQLAMLAYTWSLLFRTDDSGDYLCLVPGLLPPSALIAHIATSVLNIAWVFLADRADSNIPLVVPQTFVIVLLAALMGCVVGISYHGLKVAAAAGLSDREFLLAVVLWLNSNGLYIGWVAVASFLNIDIAIINMSNWAVDQADVLCLTNIAVLLTIYATLDLTCLKLHLLFTPYITAIWALATSVSIHFGPKKAASVISIEASVVLALVLVAKIVLAILDRKNRSITPAKLQQVAEASPAASKSALV